jgi:hypothetical protein
MSRTEQMTELDERIVAEAEADLQQLLSIEPSLEFAAKVRSRIHEGRQSRAARWGWIGVAIATAAALLLATVLRLGQGSPATQTTETARRPDTRLGVVPPTTATVSPSTTIPSHPVAIRTASTRTADAAASPEIIIDPAMTAAIQRLAAGARNTILDGSNGQSIAADANAGALPIAEPLKVPELVLSPADPHGGQ